MPRRVQGAKPKPKPLKRPTQDRAKLTVEAIYEAFVRIWRRDGWQRLTTRAVALEAGVAIGTFYDYFPNKTALHSGYVRYCIEAMIQVVDERVVQPPDLSWRTRVHWLIRLLAGLERDGIPWFHPEMLALEPEVAEHKHQQRASEELLAMWRRVFDACNDLRRPSEETCLALHLAVWGGRRYAWLLMLNREQTEAWAEAMETMCLALIDSANGTDRVMP